MTRLLEPTERPARRAAVPSPRTPASAVTPTVSAAGFHDCRGTWHAWDDTAEEARR